MQPFRILIVTILVTLSVASRRNVDEMSADFDEIDELLVDILDPDWRLQTKEVDQKSGMVTMTVVIADGTRRVTKVKSNWRGCCVIDDEWKDWRKKTKRIDPTTEMITETAFLVGGIERISETDPKIPTVRETIRYANGTTKMWERRPDSGKFGPENVTTIHADGAKEVRETDPMSGTHIVTTFFPDGTLKGRRIDEAIEESVIDVLEPRWIRKSRRVDRNGSVILTIDNYEGAQSVRILKENCANSRDCDWVQKYRDINVITGTATETVIFADGTRLVKNPYALEIFTFVGNSTVKPISEITDRNLAGVARNCDPGFAPDLRGRCRRNEDLH